MTIESALKAWENECWNAYNGEHYDDAKGCYVSDYEEDDERSKANVDTM